mmetsp:Transcript_120156/g.234070  ORF Transcript_120156/g.234070 Transcript_120156/m.234070 type:complete len:223 (+) Transcript_120156:33-701(+)
MASRPDQVRVLRRLPHSSWRLYRPIVATATLFFVASSLSAGIKRSGAWCQPPGVEGTRRTAVAAPFLGLAGAWVVGGNNPASAKLSNDELSRIKTGYEKISYLLDHWEEETTDKDGERTPDSVRAYLGLRSTTDPLFNLEKMLVKATDQVDGKMIDDFQGAIETWSTQVAEANSAAFISSYGEYNPGGGKDTIARYLEKSKINVQKCKESLQVIGKSLGLKF